MSFRTAQVTLTADLVTNGTITVAYPSLTNSGSYVGTSRHVAFARGLQNLLQAPTDFTVSFGSSNITVTYKGATTIPSGTLISFQFDIRGPDDNTLKVAQFGVRRTTPLAPFNINLGAPAAGASNSIWTSAALTAASGATAPAGGSLVTNGVAILDVPRNVVAAWTGTSVITIRGTDEYGRSMTESSASGTSFTGKKAFKTVTSIQVSADVTLLTVGTGNVLGLPVALPQASLVLGESQDGAKPTAGTTVASDKAVATATTGDVRGTYAPNATPDGSKAFQIFVLLPDPSDRGNAQF